jgi:hypothetical protein
MSDRMQRIAARQQPGRTVPIRKVLELLDAQAELARSGGIMSAIGALTEIREQLVAISGHEPLPSDEERAALDAYSVVKADRTNGGTRVFTNGHHREALMAAVTAVDTVRFHAFADSFGVKLRPTERPHVTPIGGHLGVKPLGSPNPGPESAKPAQSVGELAPLPGGGYTRTKFDLDQVRDIHREAVQLSPAQRRALLVLFEMAPRYAEGVVPGEFISSSERTLTSLSLREFIGWHDLATDGGEAHWGWRLTEAGRHAVGKLIALATGR